MKRKIEMLKLRINQHLLSKNLKLKQKIKQLEADKSNLLQEKKELIDIIDLQQANYRQLDIILRNLKDKIKKSELFKELLEVINL